MMTVVFGLLTAYTHGNLAQKSIGSTASDLAVLVVVMQLTTLACVLGLIVLGLGSLSQKSATVFAALGVVFLLLDARLYDVMGVHMYSPFIVDSLSNPGFINEVRPSVGTIATIVGLLAASIGVGMLLRWLVDRISGRDPAHPGRWAALLLLTVGGAGYGGGGWAYARMQDGQREALGDALPFFGALHGVYAPQEALTLTYPKAADAPVSKPQNILLILAESLRADALTPELMPFLAQFTQQAGCFVSPRHYANSHTTVFGAFAFLSGLGPHHFPAMRDVRRPLLPLTILQQNGYLLEGASASQLRNWQNAGFMLEPFAAYKEYTRHAAGSELYLNDVDMLADLPQLFKRTSRPYARFVFLVSTHWNYSYPPQYERDVPVAPADFNAYAENLDDEGARQAIRNRYRNAVRYVDEGIRQLLAHHQADIDDGRLAVVIAGDHGEEFWEHGRHGHGATRFHDERIRTPLVMCLPGANVEGVTLSSHVDVIPTLFDYLGVAAATRAELFDGVSLLSEAGRDVRRAVIVSGAGFPEQSRKLAVITNAGKFIYQKVTPRLDGLRLEETWSNADVPTTGLEAPSPTAIGATLSRFLQPSLRR